MPREQPLAQDLMQEDLSSNGSQVEQFLSPTIFPGQQQASKPPAAPEHRLHAVTNAAVREHAFGCSNFPFTDWDTH